MLQPWIALGQEGPTRAAPGTRVCVTAEAIIPDGLARGRLPLRFAAELRGRLQEEAAKRGLDLGCHLRLVRRHRRKQWIFLETVLVATAEASLAGPRPKDNDWGWLWGSDGAAPTCALCGGQAVPSDGPAREALLKLPDASDPLNPGVDWAPAAVTPGVPVVCTTCALMVESGRAPSRAAAVGGTSIQ